MSKKAEVSITLDQANAALQGLSKILSLKIPVLALLDFGDVFESLQSLPEVRSMDRARQAMVQEFGEKNANGDLEVPPQNMPAFLDKYTESFCKRKITVKVNLLDMDLVKDLPEYEGLGMDLVRIRPFMDLEK